VVIKMQHIISRRICTWGVALNSEHRSDRDPQIPFALIIERAFEGLLPDLRLPFSRF